jgi:hypothetical protein
VSGACEPEAGASWLVTCGSATIAATKSTGAVWDSTSSSPPGTYPDATCALSLPDGRMRTTAAVTDSLMPVWSASVTPTSGGPLTAKMLMSAQTHLAITVVDVDANDSDQVCTTMPVFTAADLARGSLTLTKVGSCKTLTLGLTCASPSMGPGGVQPL